MMKNSLFWVLALALCAACGDDDGGDDTTDGSVEDMAPPVSNDGGVGPMDLPGLDGAVEVIVDDRGMPHIYATTIHDLMVVQGYLMSQDRFIQMEFIRRGVTGRLAEVLGGLEPSLVDDDRDSRFLGFKRQGEAIYASLADDSRSKLAADAFVEGINLYIEEVVEADGYRSPLDLEVFNLMREAGIGRWTGADIFALARFQAWNLSYDAGADTARTEALLGVQEAFPPPAPGPAGDEVLESRAGIFGDFYSEVQARRVYTRDGLPASDPFTTAPLIFERELPAFTPEALRGAQTFFDRLDTNPLFRRDEHVGSNSWVVSGAVTESGNPILSNDPHLGLTSPGIWWYVHLNTAEMGGEDDIDVQGVAFAGLPGVVLGYNRDLAWSATTTGYDVTDVYSEVVTYRFEGADADPPWVPVSVSFEGADVPVGTIDEEIAVSGSDTPTTYRIYDVPHHGPIIPGSEAYPDVTDPTVGDTGEGGALSVRYTGHEVTNELGFFVALMTATNVDEAAAAHREFFQVGAQNIAMVARNGDIAWSSHAWIPQREAAACTFSVDADGVVDGVSPLFVLPGEGGYEWLGDIDDAAIPQAKNPAENFIATANQDNAGVTDDGNPCNESVYIGGGFAVGYRMGRITENLQTMTEAGGITPAMMIELQAETKSSLGETSRDPIVAALDHALGDPSDDDALNALVTEAGSDGTNALQDVRDRLAAWSLETPHGVGATDSSEIADSVATTIFNATITRLTGLAFDDEEAAIGRGMSSSYNARMLEWSLADATTQEARLYTFRAEYQGDTEWNDTVVWDDITTDAVLETRDERVTRAVLNAVAWLTEELGDDWDQWRWGRLHAVRFDQIAPSISGLNRVSIPPGGSDEFPIGFPRHGDYGAVDVGNFSMTNGERFTHGSGASQRLVVEMTPDGPVMPFNALPGGQSEDIRNPHHADEAELWRMNEQPPLYFTREDVEANGELTFTISPR